MKLPAGTDGGTITNPQDESFIDELASFRGAVEIRTPAGTGFFLIDQGRIQAAFFRTATESSRGESALARMTAVSDDPAAAQTFHLRKYTDEEYARALEIGRTAGLLIETGEEREEREGTGEPGEAASGGAVLQGSFATGTAPVPQADAGPPAAGAAAEPRRAGSTAPPELDQSKLKKILSQPGVIAVSAFFEGFPVQSMGDADFEKVAASAEDFMRAGVKIAQEMNAGPLDQMILETAGNKFIIAPCGDLFLCIFTTADTQLGLIRVVLKSIQS